MPTELEPRHRWATRLIETATTVILNTANTRLWRNPEVPLWLGYIPTVAEGPAPYDGMVYLYEENSYTGAGERVSDIRELVVVGRLPLDPAHRARWVRSALASAPVLPADRSRPICVAC